MPLDRRQQLLAQNKLVGLDFVLVEPTTQAQIDVFFVRDPVAPPLTTPFSGVNDLVPDNIVIERIGSEETPERIKVTALTWAVADGRNVVRLTLAGPGGFALYRLTIKDPQGRIDPVLNGVVFSFKAACPSDLDCEAEPRPCPPEAPFDFPVDYSARDFWSIRQALLDYASQRRPEWKDRLDADIGLMWAELLSAVGDEFQHQADTIFRQGSLETATELRSIRRHARLVDYEIDDGEAAFAWLAITADPIIGAGVIWAGTPVWDAAQTLVFEVGHGLHEQPPNLHLGSTVGGISYPVDPSVNALKAYIWDENATCLFAGATRVHVEGHHAAVLAGRRVILTADPLIAGKPTRRWCVQLTGAVDTDDPLAPVATPLTELAWAAAEATPFDIDLEVLNVLGNVVPATAGQTRRVVFQIGGPAAPTDGSPPGPVERIGPNGAVIQLQGLMPDTDVHGLVWTKRDEARTRPDVALYEATQLLTGVRNDDAWTWRRSFVGTNSSQPTDTHFVLEDGLWRRIVGYQRVGGDVVHRDYATNQGSTIRLPDGQFGRAAPDRQLFQAVYRIFHGTQGNIAADSLVGFDRAGGGNPALVLPFVQAITNPLAANGGRDPESVTKVKENAPEAFRRVTFRAVRPEDYAAAAETLPWVQRAGADQRWTGSWLTTFVTADPLNSTQITAAQRRELFATLDRYRQTGRDLATLDARYADLDLVINICVEPSTYRGEVEERCLEALFDNGGFFDPDNFTFGTPLERSRLEATLQAVPGVRAVEEILIRRRGFFPQRVFAELVWRPAASEVIRIDNSRLTPELGAVKLEMRGGA